MKARRLQRCGVDSCRHYNAGGLDNPNCVSIGGGHRVEIEYGQECLYGRCVEVSSQTEESSELAETVHLNSHEITQSNP